MAEDQVMLPPLAPRPPSVVVNPNNKRPNNLEPLENPSNNRARISKDSSVSSKQSSLAVLASSSISSFTNESMAQSLERRKQSLDEEYRNRPVRISKTEFEWIKLLRSRPESDDSPEFLEWMKKILENSHGQREDTISSSIELSSSSSGSNSFSSSEEGPNNAIDGKKKFSAGESRSSAYGTSTSNTSSLSCEEGSSSSSSAYGASTSNTSCLSCEEGSSSSSSNSRLVGNQITDESAES